MRLFGYLFGAPLYSRITCVAGTLCLTGDATARLLLHGSGAGWRGKSLSPCRASNPRRVGLDEIVMGSRGAGTLPCRAGGGWVPRGRHASSAMPLHTTGCRVDGVWGERKSPHWCGKARCQFPRHGQRDATGERSVSLAKIGVVLPRTSCGSR